MPGRYLKAPLVYVTAKLIVSSVPELNPEQFNSVQQALLKLGLVHPVKGRAERMDLQVDSSGVRPLFSSFSRFGFFDKERQKCLIIDQRSIEWRASIYNRYNDFIDEFQNSLTAVLSVIESYGFLIVEELALSYSDIIIPTKKYNLADFFEASNKILPLSFLGENEGDVFRFGHVQVTRVVQPDQKIVISLEQLPIEGGNASKVIPEAMVEPDPELAQNILERPEWSASEQKEYALLMTQAAKLCSDKLNSVSTRAAFLDLHELTKDTFTKLVNEQTCKEVWEYKEE